MAKSTHGNHVRGSIYLTGVDRSGIHIRVRVEVEVADPLVPRKTSGLDPADRGAPVAVIALGQQQFGKKPLIAELLLLSHSDCGCR